MTARISQGAHFLQELVRMVSRGALVPAAFQRPYVWSQDDVLALVVSLLKRYPVGSFLLWTPGHALGQYRRSRLGPIAADTSLGNAGSSLLLDGQNRLASLAWMTHDPAAPLPADISEMERQTWGEHVLMMDLFEEKFVFIGRNETPSVTMLPSYLAFDTMARWRLIHQRWDADWTHLSEQRIDQMLRWMDEVDRAFSDARVTVTEIHNASAQEARDAFLHICRVGVPMSEADFDAALNWA